mgnify:CR=1 FL=1
MPVASDQLVVGGVEVEVRRVAVGAGGNVCPGNDVNLDDVTDPVGGGGRCPGDAFVGELEAEACRAIRRLRTARPVAASP